MRSHARFLSLLIVSSVFAAGCADSNESDITTVACSADADCIKENAAAICDTGTGFCRLTMCGNGILDEGEACDKNAFGNASCASVLNISEAFGDLRCNPDCTIDITSCNVKQCTGSQTYCDENVWHYCDAGMDRTKVCGSGEYANKPNCEDTLGCVATTQTCVDGETGCNGKQPVRCLDGQWVNNGNVCEYGCSEVSHQCQAQTMVCEENAVQCHGSTVQTCVSGNWVDAESPCVYGCTDGRCHSEGVVCVEGKVQCNGAFVETCQDNAWVKDPSPCNHGCFNGACIPEGVTCAEDQRQCNGARIQVCIDNAWIDTVSCTNGCDGGQCLHNCESGDKTCNGLQPQKCQVIETGNVYTNDGVACTYGCDATNGTCTSANACSGPDGNVETGSEGCASASQYGLCNNGAWINTYACTNGCAGGKCIDSCTEGQRTCDGLQPKQCQLADSGNVFVNDGALCTYGCDRMTGQCLSASACHGAYGDIAHEQPGCVSETQYGTCNNGRWTGTKVCAAGCVDDVCYDVCVPDTYRCSDKNTLQVCNRDGSGWITSTVCSGDAPVCHAATHSCICQEDTMRCAENKVEGCVDGNWTLLDACKANETCTMAADGYGECLANPPTTCTTGTGKDIDDATFGCMGTNGTAYGVCMDGVFAYWGDCTVTVEHADPVCLSDLEGTEDEPCWYQCQSGYKLGTDGYSCVLDEVPSTVYTLVAETDICPKISALNTYAGTLSLTLNSATNVKCNLKGNCPSEGSEKFYMDNTSSIVVTGTTKVSKVTVEARSNSSSKELEIIAGSYTASHKFSTTVTSHTFEITDTSATGFSLKAAAKSVQVLSLRWE